MERILNLEGQVAELSSSFQGTPVGMERLNMSRPRGRRGYRSTKPRQYADEWDKEIKMRPENTGFFVEYEASAAKFKLMFSEQHNSTIVEKWACDCSHVVIKTYFLLLGLNGYNCENFCNYVKTHEVTLCTELSPEGSEVLRYQAPAAV